MPTTIVHDFGPTVSLPKASGTVFISGQLVSYESNACVHMDAATEDSTLVGVCSIGAPSGELTVTVTTWCVINVACTSATYSFGAGLKYSAGDSSTAYSLVADGSANTIAHVWGDYSDSAVTRINAAINIWALRKLLAISA